jgi:CubicO group peptidase (beta-lactamase class C family)
MNRFATPMLGAICALLFTFNVQATPVKWDDPDSLEAFVDGVVEPLMKNNNSPAGTVAITRHGELVFAKGYGFQDLDKRIPVDPYVSMFRPGSTSKLFTWVSVMQLVEQGKLDLDTDVNTYLKTFKIKDTFEQPITLRNIMTHTPGFEDGAMGYLIAEDTSRVLPLAEAMARYQPERVNPPGKQTSYSNYATSLAGLIVSNVSGLEFTDYIQKNILDPLGMDHSSFVEPLPEDLEPDMTVSYKSDKGRLVEQPFEIITNFAPAGALSSTSIDMVKFGQAILNGGELNGVRILKQETVDEMLSEQFSHDPRLMGMALGFYATDYNGFRVMGHGGDTRWFHSYLGIDAENDLTFFVSFASSGGSPVRSSFAPAFYQELYPRIETPPTPPEGFFERAGKYAGDYGFWRNSFSKLEKALGVASSLKIIPTPENTIILTFSGKAKQYVEVEKNLFREQDPGYSLVPGISPRQLAFQENDKGEITGFVMDGLPFMSLRKLPAWETPNFNLTLLGFSLLIFLLVLLRRFYQRAAIRSFSAADRSAVAAAVYAAGANLLVLVAGAAVMSAVGDRLFIEIPTVFKAWLVLPIIATLAGLYLLYRTLGVWAGGLLAGFWARLRYTIITLCALFMCWFYYFWNILGFQYLT